MAISHTHRPYLHSKSLSDNTFLHFSTHNLWPANLVYNTNNVYRHAKYITVTVTKALVLRPLLEDRGRITESIRIMVPADSMKKNIMRQVVPKLFENEHISTLLWLSSRILPTYMLPGQFRSFQPWHDPIFNKQMDWLINWPNGLKKVLNKWKKCHCHTVVQQRKGNSDPVNFLFIVTVISEHLWTDVNVSSYWSTSLVALTVAGIGNHV